MAFPDDREQQKTEKIKNTLYSAIWKVTILEVTVKDISVPGEEQGVCGFQSDCILELSFAYLMGFLREASEIFSISYELFVRGGETL